MSDNQQAAVDWSVRDVMVGVLHNERQLGVNLANHFYHMPARLLAGGPQQIRYIALYQSRRIFGDSSGVRLYGLVREHRLLRRGEIVELPTRNPDEQYYRFDIEEWLELERPIAARGLAPGVCMFTSLYLLRTSRCFPELYMRTREQVEFYDFLCAAAARTRRSGGSELLPSVEGYTVMIAAYAIGVYTPDGRYEQYDLREFYREPFQFLVNMQKYVQIKN